MVCANGFFFNADADSFAGALALWPWASRALRFLPLKIPKTIQAKHDGSQTCESISVSTFSFNSWLAGSFVEKPRHGYQPSLQDSTAHGPCVTHSGYCLQGAQKALLTKVVKNSGIQASAFCIGRQVEQIVVFRSKLERHNAMLPRKACEPRSGLQMELEQVGDLLVGSKPLKHAHAKCKRH